MLQTPTSQLALVAFDTDRPFAPEAAMRLERTLQISERWSLAAGVKVRAAILTESPKGRVVATSVAQIPPHHDADFIQQQVEGAVRHVTRDQGETEPRARNIALVAIDGKVRTVADTAAALRSLLEQAGDAHDRFGKILRIFLPSMPAGGKPTVDDYRLAAARLRQQMKMHVEELSRDAKGSDLADAMTEVMTGAMADSQPTTPTLPQVGGDIRVADAIDALIALGLAEPAPSLLTEVRTLHAELQALSHRSQETQQKLLPKVEAAVRLCGSAGALVPRYLTERLERYADKVLIPLSALDKLLR